VYRHGVWLYLSGETKYILKTGDGKTEQSNNKIRGGSLKVCFLKKRKYIYAFEGSINN